MNKCIFLVFLFLPKFILSQSNFSAEYAIMEPSKLELNHSLSLKIEVHQLFLRDALRKKDIKASFFGTCFLVSDYMRKEDYVTAQIYILKADSIANNSDNKLWQGHVLHRKAILALRLMNYEEAIKYYTRSLSYCKEGNDVNCLAETYEQLSMLYGKLDETSKSDSLYAISLDLFTKHGTEKQLATSYNNRATSLIKRDLYAESISLYQQAIAIYKKLSLLRDMTKATNNLADAYYQSSDFQRALNIVDECIVINKTNKFYENLFINYSLKSAILESTNNYKESKAYFEKYVVLKDSLIGITVQSKIAEVVKNYELQKSKNIIIETELELLRAQNANRLKLYIIFTILLLAIGLLPIFLSKIKEGLRKIKDSKKVISNLNISHDLDTVKISELESDIQKFKSIIKQKNQVTSANNNSNLYKPILTHGDWVAFKKYFEDNYPGYITNLRENYPHITDSEERLFLLIKLNLKNSEIANILGIAPDSVKKTRTRLKNKLNISKDNQLDDFIKGY